MTGTNVYVRFAEGSLYQVVVNCIYRTTQIYHRNGLGPDATFLKKGFHTFLFDMRKCQNAYTFLVK